MGKIKEYYHEEICSGMQDTPPYDPEPVLKDCPECYGTCVVLDSYNLSTGKEDVCPYCHGTGQVYMKEQDLADEMENEIIGNAKMMNDD